MKKDQDIPKNKDDIPNEEALKTENPTTNFTTQLYTATNQSQSSQSTSKQPNQFRKYFEKIVKNEKLEMRNYLDDMYVDKFKKEKYEEENKREDRMLKDTSTVGPLDTTVMEGILEEDYVSFFEVTSKTKGMLKILEDIVITTNNPMKNYFGYVV